MVYTTDSHIISVEDVKIFFHHLIEDRKLNFHPDDDFADYICYADNTPIFTQDEVTKYNRLMDESFGVCKDNGTDIYNIGLDELKNKLMGNHN